MSYKEYLEALEKSQQKSLISLKMTLEELNKAIFMVAQLPPRDSNDIIFINIPKKN